MDIRSWCGELHFGAQEKPFVHPTFHNECGPTNNAGATHSGVNTIRGTGRGLQNAMHVRAHVANMSTTLTWMQALARYSFLCACDADSVLAGECLTVGSGLSLYQQQLACWPAALQNGVSDTGWSLWQLSFQRCVVASARLNMQFLVHSLRNDLNAAKPSVWY